MPHDAQEGLSIWLGVETHEVTAVKVIERGNERPAQMLRYGLEAKLHLATFGNHVVIITAEESLSADWSQWPACRLTHADTT